MTHSRARFADNDGSSGGTLYTPLSLVQRLLSRKKVGRRAGSSPKISLTGKVPPKDCWLTMLRIPHELREEFPEAVTVIDGLIEADHDFARLAADYDEINRAIYQIESEEEPTSDERLEELKRQRLNLKDKIAGILAKVM